ncbi:hypothetical protein FSST1_006885 [Fusarium sambucinum]
MASNRYVYSPLTNDKNIRLLRLSPSTSFSDRIEGYLFEYTLSKSGKNAHLYEALSYTWGAPDKKHSIWIEGDELQITANCHAALSQLRDDLLDRIIWIDAICIDQANKDERGTQVQLMAEIYCKARQVIVWLGEATPETEGALEHIRTAAEEGEGSTIPECQSVVALLQRPWFRRIWVLQEVAAARHVVVACGTTQIDGYAFCLGLPPHVYEESSSAAVRSIEFLIKRSIFRPKYTQDASGRVTFGIRPLGELMDMYHSHDATEPLDRVFALLGMSTDGLSAPELVPNYNTPWHVLFDRLINFVLGRKVLVKTFVDRRIAIICGQGTVIGKVVSVSSSFQNRDPQATISYAKDFQTLGSTDTWTFHPAVESVACGDLLCWLDGASNPMAIRSLKTHLSVIMISVTPTRGILDLLPMSKLLNFPLVWNHEADWRNTRDCRSQSWLADEVLSCAESHPQKSVREGNLFRDVARVLVAADQCEDAAELFDNASESYISLRGKDDLLMINCLEELAIACHNMQQWAAAKDLWEYIIRTSYAIRQGILDTLAYLDNFMLTLEHAGYTFEESKWRQTTHILQAKQSDTLLTDEKVLEITSSYDTEVVSILLDQLGSDACVDEQMLIAVAQNESHGASVMEFLLNRSNPEPEITEGILVAGGGIHSPGKKLTAIPLERRDKEAKITQNLLQTAAANSHCNQNLMQVLLSHQGSTFDLGDVAEGAWAELALFLKARHAVNSEGMEFKQTMSLVQRFWNPKDITILEIVLSATDPKVLSRGSRELLQFACDRLAFPLFRFFLNLSPPSLKDIIHTLAYASLQYDKSDLSDLVEVITSRCNDANDPCTVAKEVVNECCRIMKTGTPAELSFFIDGLNQLQLPPQAVMVHTQSAILSAIASDDPSFLKILVERRLVSVLMTPFSIKEEQRSLEGRLPEIVGERTWKFPPAGMPDLPLYCAIVFVRDIPTLRYLCRAGARLNCYLPDQVTNQEEPPIVASLREQNTLQIARAKFVESLKGFSQILGFGRGKDSGLPRLQIDWQFQIYGRVRASARSVFRPMAYLYLGFNLYRWPKPLSSEDSWKQWREEAITALGEYYREASD